MSLQLISRNELHWTVVIVCDGGCGYQTIPIVFDEVLRPATPDEPEESNLLSAQRDIMRSNAKRLRQLEKDCDLVRRADKHLCFSCEARESPAIQQELFDVGEGIEPTE